MTPMEQYKILHPERLLQEVKAKEYQINSLRLQFCQSQGIALTNVQIDAHMLRCVENQKIEQPYYP